MSLFEVVRAWDAWPRLTGSQVLRSLFRQVPTHSRAEAVSCVFMTFAHLFVGTGAEDTGSDCLYVFSSSGEDERGGGDCRLPLASEGGQTVGVVSVVGEREVCVVREGGWLELFSHESPGWRKTGGARLSTHRVLRCVLHPASRQLVYCVRLPGDPADHSHQILARCYHLGSVGEEQRLQLHEPTVLLTACPDMSLWPWQEGVALLPRSSPEPSPPGLLLLWLPQQPPLLQPFFLNSRCPATDSLPSGDYPTLCLQLAPHWTTTPLEPRLLSVTVNSTTDQLLLLLSSGEVCCVQAQGRRTRTTVVVRLADFSLRYRLPEARKTDLQLFTIHTYYGIFCKGEIRLYEGFSGELVWESDEHEGPDVRLLAPPTSFNWIGLHGNSGVWVLRSRRLLEHSQLVAQALFPITTNADETTPGDYLEQGRVLAALLCWLWGLALPATRNTLEALHGNVQQDREEEVGEKEGELFLPDLSQELEAMLRTAALQSPALLVALLTEHPRHRRLVREAVSVFTEAPAHSTATALNKEVAGLLQSHNALCLHYQQQLSLWGEEVAKQLLLSPQAMATSLLHRLECCHDNSHASRVAVRAQLVMLSGHTPAEVLAGALDHFSLSSFAAAVTQLEGGAWSSDRDWKSLLGTEAGSGVGRGVLQSPAPSLPLFELTCRLLYLQQPQELEHFVRFAQLARDHQARGDSSFARRCRKSYFFQRALQCLPQFVSPETTPTSREALLAHSHLILQSEGSGCGGSALGLLVRGRLWEEALSLVDQWAARDSPSHSALFHTLLASMAQAGTLHCYMERAWQLRPKRFSVFDFLSVLQCVGRTSHHPPPLLVVSRDALTVDDVSSRLQELLQTQSLNTS